MSPVSWRVENARNSRAKSPNIPMFCPLESNADQGSVSKGHNPVNNPTLRWCGTALIGFGMLMLACAVGVSVWPKSNAATVRLKVEKEANGLQIERGGFDPYWIQTEFETIQSKVVLYTVVTNLNLHKKWSGQSKKPVDVPSAYTMLKRMIDVRQARN